MKKKKLLPLFLIPFLLTSCDLDSFHGRYVFQLGKEQSTHIGIFLQLNKTVYEPKKAEGYKSCHISGSFGSSEETMLSDDLIKILNEGLDGYYFVKNINDKNRIFFGTQELGEAMGIDYDLDVDQDLVENVAIGYIKHNEVDIVIPVSLEDLQMQLVWYGHFAYVNFDDPLNPIMHYEELTNLPGSQDKDLRIGTHPTKEEVIIVNQRYKSLFDEYNFEFRNHHTLTLTLTKD